jgi:hypothetical protein
MDREASLLEQAMALVPGGTDTGSRDEVCDRLEAMDMTKWRREIAPIEEEFWRRSVSDEIARQLVAFVESRRSELFLD